MKISITTSTDCVMKDFICRKIQGNIYGQTRGESSGFSKNIGCFAQFSFLSLRTPGVVVAAAGSLVHFWFQSETDCLLMNVSLFS